MKLPSEQLPINIWFDSIPEVLEIGRSFQFVRFVPNGELLKGIRQFQFESRDQFLEFDKTKTKDKAVDLMVACCRQNHPLVYFSLFIDQKTRGLSLESTIPESRSASRTEKYWQKNLNKLEPWVHVNTNQWPPHTMTLTNTTVYTDTIFRISFKILVFERFCSICIL